MVGRSLGCRAGRAHAHARQLRPPTYIRGIGLLCVVVWCAADSLGASADVNKWLIITISGALFTPHIVYRESSLSSSVSLSITTSNNRTDPWCSSTSSLNPFVTTAHLAHCLHTSPPPLSHTTLSALTSSCKKMQYRSSSLGTLSNALFRSTRTPDILCTFTFDF